MTDFVEALRAKIAALEEEKAQLTEQLDAKIAVLTELLGEEDGSLPTTLAKKKPGRPKGSGKKAVVSAKPLTKEEEDLHREAAVALQSMGGGTDPDQAKKIASRFVPMARGNSSYGKGVKLDSKLEIDRKRNGDVAEGSNHISIEEGE